MAFEIRNEKIELIFGKYPEKLLCEKILQLERIPVLTGIYFLIL